jgi:hypothetical protein
MSEEKENDPLSEELKRLAKELGIDFSKISYEHERDAGLIKRTTSGVGHAINLPGLRDGDSFFPRIEILDMPGTQRRILEDYGVLLSVFAAPRYAEVEVDLAAEGWHKFVSCPQADLEHNLEIAGVCGHKETRVEHVAYQNTILSIYVAPGQSTVYVKKPSLMNKVPAKVIEFAKEYLALEADDARKEFLMNVQTQVVHGQEGEYAGRFAEKDRSVLPLLHYVADKLTAIGLTDPAEELRGAAAKAHFGWMPDPGKGGRYFEASRPFSSLGDSLKYFRDHRFFTHDVHPGNYLTDIIGPKDNTPKNPK